jgi:acetyl-CoA carboxylase carboxyl transferase subunit alpha
MKTHQLMRLSLHLESIKMAENITGQQSQFSGGQILEFERPLAQIEQQILELERQQGPTGRDCAAEARKLRSTLVDLMKKTYNNLKPWEKVQVARHQKRPQSMDYIRMIVRDFCEINGDRQFRNDKSIVTGFGRLAGHKCMIVGNRKGKDIKEKVECYFGCAHPEGYRKALLKMKLAEKFKLPVVCLIDTPGAYPGIGAEERGIAQAIAVNLLEMSRLQTPVICVVIAEGGSGGALGIGVGDRIAAMEHAYYSVITPEGCAAILWKTAEKAPEAAECLKLTPKDLKKLKIIDDIIPEPLGGAHRDPTGAASHLEHYLAETLTKLKRMPLEKLLQQRYEKLRHVGEFFRDKPTVAAKPVPKSALNIPAAKNSISARSMIKV